MLHTETGIKNLSEQAWNELTTEQRQAIEKNLWRVNSFEYITKSRNGILYLETLYSERSRSRSRKLVSTPLTGRVITIAPNGLISERTV